ncbi:MAG: GyrI-like domain-containing protein [Bacteroidales bacterium]|nr:GyrI-like domain-containing protein [Bacteroidales bacterium]
MAFDFKKEYKEFYLPAQKPALVTVPRMSYVAVRGEGDPNTEGSAYKRSIEVLYAVAYTIKMSKMGDHRIEGYFDFVVPPLEGLWWTTDGQPLDFGDKGALQFISMIRLPDFVGRADFDWAVTEATRKKKLDCSAAEFFNYDEGLCVQCMHMGPYDDEPVTIAAMKAYAESTGHPFAHDERMHHEIYLSDPRKTALEKLKTVIRIPIA